MATPKMRHRQAAPRVVTVGPLDPPRKRLPLRRAQRIGKGTNMFRSVWLPDP